MGITAIGDYLCCATIAIDHQIIALFADGEVALRQLALRCEQLVVGAGRDGDRRGAVESQQLLAAVRVFHAELQHRGLSLGLFM